MNRKQLHFTKLLLFADFLILLKCPFSMKLGETVAYCSLEGDSLDESVLQSEGAQWFSQESLI